MLELTPTERIRVHESIDAIAVDLAREVTRLPAELRDMSQSCASTDFDLAHGHCGTAVLFAELVHHGDERYAEPLRACVDQLARATVALEWRPGLFVGAGGIAATLQCLLSTGTCFDEDPLSTFDEKLFAWPETYAEDALGDLIRGLIGVGVYAGMRLPSVGASACMERIVERLARTASPTANGVEWAKTVDSFPPRTVNRVSNLGVAHGAAGVVGFLCRAVEAGIGGNTAVTLLERAVENIVAIKGEERANGYQDPRERASWCWGDPGLALVLMSAGRAARNDAWATAGQDLADALIARNEVYVGMVDPCLCHGCAGLTHLYLRIAARTGDEEHAKVAKNALLRTLDLRTRVGIGGFQFLVEQHRSSKPIWGDSSGLLFGASGVALAMLSAVGRCSSGWDRVLLLSPP